jgi:hypothetical protein
MAGKGIQPKTKGSGRSAGGKRKRAPGSPPARPSAAASPRPQVIPDAVANRMARRIAIATGIPTLMGMGVFVASYLLVSRGVIDIPPGATLVASGGCFLLGLLGLSYGVLSASWEPQAGSWLGTEQIGLNLSRVRASLKALRRGGAGTSGGSGR